MFPVSVSSTATPALEDTSDGRRQQKDSLSYLLKFFGEKELWVYQLYQNNLQYLEFS